MKRLVICFSVAMISLLTADALAGKFQGFNYRSDKGLVRICKGDTASGQAICADGTAVSALTAGTARPKWEVAENTTTYYLKYDMGQEPSAPGRYAFFVYYSNRGEVRVCAGDTATGVANCVNGTSESGRAKGTEQPSFTASERSRILVLRYFPEEEGKVGQFGFMSYANTKGLVRVCRTNTESGEIVCVDGTAVSASVKGKGKPEWETSERARLMYLKY